MKGNPSMEVDLKGPETTNQIFLSPIENFPYIKEKNLFLSIEYYLCTAISVFLWSYFTTSSAFRSYNFILKNREFSPFAYLSKFRDYNDEQWNYFRQNFFISFLIIPIIFVITSQFIKKYYEQNLKNFYLISGIIYGFYLVQLRIIYLFLACCAFYYSKDLVKIFREKAYMSIWWIELFSIKFVIKFLQSIIGVNNIINVNVKMDNYSWEIILIYSLLKMMSFNLEYKKVYNNETVPESIFNLNQAKSHCMQCYDSNFCTKCLENTVVTEKEKIDDSFSLENFIIYIFYPPLFYTGPLLNFNSFLFQMNIYKDSQHNKILKMNKILYLLKIILLFAAMEIYNHFIYPIYLFRKDTAFEPNSDVSLFYYCFICLNILTFLWLKFSIIWKISRLMAWCDGIFVEENMNRFIYNFYSIELFFRGTNRSLNRWLVRYIYIPLGGKNQKYINIWIVFGFWYLIFNFKSIDYAIFALCICVLFDLEMFLKNTFINKYGEDFNEKIQLRYGKYLVCSCFIFILFILGLLGFHFSIDNLKAVFDVVIEKGGYFYFLNFIIFLIPNVVTMFFIRDMELENNVLLHQRTLNY